MINLIYIINFISINVDLKFYIISVYDERPFWSMGRFTVRSLLDHSNDKESYDYYIWLC